MAFLKYKCAECGAEIFAKSADEVQRHGNLTFCSYKHLANYVNRIEREQVIAENNKRLNAIKAEWNERARKAEQETAEFHAKESKIAKDKYEDSHKATVSVEGVSYSPDKSRLVEVPKNISTFEVPEGVTEICYKAFAGCESLTSVKLPNTLKIIEQEAFRDCTQLTSITIPASVTKVGDSAFENCESLKDLIISEGVTELGAKCFLECRSLETVSIPKSIKKIGVGEQHSESFGALNIVGCFEDCTSLSTVILPEGMEEIPPVMFINCKALKTISIPESVTRIGKFAFYLCGLESITIPAGVTNIDYKAFAFCENLQYVNYLGKKPILGDDVFYDTAFYNAQKKREEKKKKKKNLILCPFRNLMFWKHGDATFTCIISAVFWFFTFWILDITIVKRIILSVIVSYLAKTIPDMIIYKGDIDGYHSDKAEKLWKIVYALLGFIIPALLFLSFLWQLLIG